MREAVVTVGDSEFFAMGPNELVSLWRAIGLRNIIELSCHGTTCWGNVKSSVGGNICGTISESLREGKPLGQGKGHRYRV